MASMDCFTLRPHFVGAKLGTKLNLKIPDRVHAAAFLLYCVHNNVIDYRWREAIPKPCIKVNDSMASLKHCHDMVNQRQGEG